VSLFHKPILTIVHPFHDKEHAAARTRGKAITISTYNSLYEQCLAAITGRYTHTRTPHPPPATNTCSLSSISLSTRR